MLQRMHNLFKLLLIVICLVGSFQSSLTAQELGKDALGALRYRYIGPVGNRVTCVVGIPGQPNIYYVGAASGGIWKTTDGGTHWEPIFDDQPVSSIGSLAISPSEPAVIWAGTGESHIRSHISVGAGIYKSTDAGKTWKLMGLEKTGRIARIVIDPKNPDTVLVAAMGHSYGPQQERGVFRTTDGGKNWERVLFVDANTGASDVLMEPSNPRVVYAGMWPLEIRTWGRESGGPGSGLHKSTDGGITWRKLSGRGLPTRTTGKVTLAIAPSNPNRVYALIETGDGVPVNGKETDRGKLWRSEDGGENWRLISYDRTLGGRTHYYFRMMVAPDNENETYYLTAGFAVSLDGGESLRSGGGFGSSPGGDNHDMWIDPTNPSRMAVANDGGVSISVTRGKSWNRIQLPIAQMYHVTVDNRIPYFVYGNEQDDPSYRGPSRVASGGFGGGGIPRSAWHAVAGGESGWATPDPVDPNIIWSSASGSGSIGGIVERYDLRNGQARNVEVWPDQTNGSPAGELKYRFVWTFPLTISPHNHKKLYVGSQHVHQTTDDGQSWQIISPDLTTNDKSKQGFSGGLTGDNIGVEYFSTLFAIAESPKEKGLIWTGSNDGLVHLTRDGGKNWTNVTKNIPGLPPLGTISNIEPSRYDAAAAYLTVDLHQVNNRDPFIYKTKDYGNTWKRITDGIPPSMLSYAHCVREDPTKQGLLYVGTENGLYVSWDDGEHWEPLQSNLPRVPVYWLVIQEHFNDLVVGTYGRGFWILDDLTPIQQMTDAVRNSNAHLFPVRPTYRFRPGTVPVTMSDDPTAGQNPPYGAAINYYLKTAPGGEVRIKIVNAKGETVRTLTGTKNVGLNRTTWDLRGEPTREVRMRTSPAYAPEITVGADGTRPALGAARMSVLLPPGNYTVRLSVGSLEASQPLVVRKDPNSSGTEADIETQLTMLLDLRSDVDKTAEMVNQIEVIRSQLYHITALLGGASSRAGIGGAERFSRSTVSEGAGQMRQAAQPRALATEGAPSAAGAPRSVLPASAGGADFASIKSAADVLDKQLIDIEEALIQRRLTGQGQDTVRWPPRLISKLNYLSSGLGGSDFPPTTQQREVHATFKTQLSSLRSRLDEVVNKDLDAFNKLLRDRGIGNVISR
ncbi:MAG: sialidase [Acidobacteriota bacterium]